MLGELPYINVSSGFLSLIKSSVNEYIIFKILLIIEVVICFLANRSKKYLIFHELDHYVPDKHANYYDLSHSTKRLSCRLKAFSVVRMARIILFLSRRSRSSR